MSRAAKWSEMLGNNPSGKPGDSGIDWEQKLLGGMNPEQREVVLHDKGPLLVAAVAGSGKTAALVNRIGHLVRVREVRASRILAVTFSKKAAGEMQERLDALIGESPARVGTFHSFALEVFRAEIGSGSTGSASGSVAGWTVDDRDRYRVILKTAVGYREMDWKEADVSYLSWFVSFCKAHLADPGTPEAMEIAEEAYKREPKPGKHPRRTMDAYARAESIRKDRLLLTFDDMLCEAVRIFRADDSIRQRWASRFDYVLQDECQDQSKAQLVLGEMMARDHRNYMLVGDLAQTIYSWRGAKPEMLLSFEKDWGARVIMMNRNYRCGHEIIEAANKSLAAMDPSERLDMQIVCERKTTAVVTSTQYMNQDVEAEALALRIQQALVDGRKPSDFVVLYRTNGQSRGPEEALISARIPYQIIGGTNFYARREVRCLLAYLRLADGSGEMEDIERAINAPFRFLGKAFVGRVRETVEKGGYTAGAVPWAQVARKVADQEGIQRRQRASVDDWAQLMEEIGRRIAQAKLYENERENDGFRLGMPAVILEDIVRTTKYNEWLTRDEGEESTENSRVSNVREMIRAATRFQTVRELLQYVDDTIKEHNKQHRSGEDKKDLVTLCSIHRCVAPETLIETGEGLVEIGDAPPAGVVGTADGPRDFRGHVRYENRPRLRIDCDGGYELTVSHDHGLMAWNGSGYVRRQASEIAPGDWLRLRLGAQADPVALARLPPPPKDGDVHTKRYEAPVEVSEEVAEFLGLMVADGTVYRAGFRLGKRHRDVRDRFAELSERIFGCQAKRKGEDPLFFAEVNSVWLSEWLLSIGGLSPNEKAVPSVIMRSPVAVQARFLRGLFEDGTVNLDEGSGGVDHVAWHTAYERMGEIVQIMLLRLGIISSRFVPREGTGWRVAIYGDDIVRFRDRIGFVSEEKNARLMKRGPSRRSNHVIPVDPEWIRKNVDRFERIYDRQNAIARKRVSRIVAAKIGMNDELGFHHLQVRAITPDTGPVACIEVPGYGRFLQNGFDGENSKGLEFPVVHLIGCSEKVLPHARAESLEEERRLFYVGVTRAKDELHASCVRQMAVGSRVVDLPPSRFLMEAEMLPQVAALPESAGDGANDGEG